MKKLFKYSLFIVLMLNACSEKLEIEPTSSSKLDKIISTEDGLDYLKNGAYAYARKVYTRYFFHFAELLADTGEIINYSSYQQFRDLQDKTLDNTFAFSEYAWGDAYTAINNCNLIIDSIDVASGTKKTDLEANARFIRALLYFDLTRFFALPYGPGAMDNEALPLILKGVSKPEQVTYPSKATVGEIFVQVEADLRFAFENLLDEDAFYASKYSAAAILSRYFLTREMYDSAAHYADEVIESGMFALSETVFEAFNHDNYGPEDVFAWQQTGLDNEGEFNDGLAPFYASTNESGRSEFVINTDFISSVYDVDDSRGFIQGDNSNVIEISNLFYDGFAIDSRGVYTSKWLSHKSNVNMVRLAEMYLTRAEANQMVIDGGGTPENDVDPADDIAEIRSRAGIDVSGLTEVTIEDIRMERYKELIFEGHRLHDYKRWKSEVWGIPYNAEDLIVPIPKKELDANPNL